MASHLRRVSPQEAGTIMLLEPILNPLWVYWVTGEQPAPITLAGGAFIVFEALIDDERRQNAFGLLMSLNMLIETRGGFDYTGADCKRWLSEAGFPDATQTHLVGGDSMVVGLK